MSVRFRAECQDCPTTWNTDWGYDERVSKEAVDETIVRAWAWRHVYDESAKEAGTQGHRLRFSRVVRVRVDVEKLDGNLLRAIFATPTGESDA